ncbi:50S ribosomal protein L25/general stress protein Ctc [Moraxella nasovis]|uniref:50S ribosomal protein L25/general stress protein Ctc n=1 Tax=Moraxella nasovis TaxID=2904121 RepID=UPI001F5FFB56|nr:50S ribosomal protein L25/general stress protein Ctc [Moraxella nasovis]UNU74285.1 50S ribosomal protein L25/general stress protein Ctc [Moraxella nasovis]
MMSYKLNAVLRSEDKQGKGASRRLRKENLVPAIVYGGEGEALSIAIKHNELIKALSEESFFSSIITLVVDGNTEEVIIKALQRHPSKGLPLHADFQRIVRGQAMQFTVPVHFVGEATGVEAGGVLQTNITELDINCLPRQLPEFIEVDVSKLEIGDLLRLSDIKLEDGVTIADLDSGATDRVVVSVQAPTVEEEPEEEVDETEVIEGDIETVEGEAQSDDKDGKDEDKDEDKSDKE